MELEILMTESRWFARGIKESIYIRALKPSINRDRGRYNLPQVWGNIIKMLVKAHSLRRRGHHHSVQHPQQYPQDDTSEEVDRSQQKLM